MIAESIPLLLQHCKQLCKKCVSVNMEESDFKPTSKAQYLGILIDIIHEKVFLTDSQIVRFREWHFFSWASGLPLQVPLSSLFIYTDVLRTGWGHISKTSLLQEYDLGRRRSFAYTYSIYDGGRSTCSKRLPVQDLWRISRSPK